jgi:hypothetical protein
MTVDSGVKPASVTDAELYGMLKGNTHEERMKGLEIILSMVAPGYWESVGL